MIEPMPLSVDGRAVRAETAPAVPTRRRRVTGAAVAVVFAVLSLALLVFAPGAWAAPQLEVVAGERGVFPGERVTQTVSVRNVGDAPTQVASPITVVAQLPEALTAVSVTSDGSRWSCAISPGAKTVTCTGPSLPIPAGSSQCEIVIFGPMAIACSIQITMQAASGPEGRAVTALQACGGGAAGCASAAGITYVNDFGDNFGLQPINDHPEASVSVPALPGYDRAFFAGACDLAAGPAFGEPIPAPGVGAAGRQAMIVGQVGGWVTADVPSSPTATHCMDWGTVGLWPQESDIWSDPPSWRLPALAQAGSHPDGNTSMTYRKIGAGIDGAVDNIRVELPAGFVGNPSAVGECSLEAFAVKPQQCPPESQVGVLSLMLSGVAVGDNHGSAQLNLYPVWNLEPRKGRVAELGFAWASGHRVVPVRIEAKARTSGDMGVTAFVGQVPAALPLVMQSITIWGVPWAASNDQWRAPQAYQPGDSDACSKQLGASNDYLPPSGLAASCQVPYSSDWGPIKPFLTQETDCNPGPVTRLRTDQYLQPGAVDESGEPVASDPGWKTYESPSPAVSGCEKLGFEPDIALTATDPGGQANRAADSPAGLGVELAVPQNNEPPGALASDPGEPSDPIDGSPGDLTDGAPGYFRSDEGLATSHLKDSVVTLPAGVSVNPSTATGLQACSDSEVGVREQGDPPLFNNQDPLDGVGAVECPQESVLGTVRVQTPLLDEELAGHVVLGEPKSTDPQSGEMFRMFLVVRNEERGLLVKVYGSATSDPQTGRITATFRNNPELPFDNLKLDFKGGSKGVLAMPQRCGNPGWSSAFTPWSSVGAVTPVADTVDTGAFVVSENCANAFAPVLSAGMDTQAARSNGTFAFRFSRRDGEQYLRGLTARLPQGLLASVKDLPLCSNAQAGAGACPAASKIGIVDAKAGSGDPFVLEEKGEVFLTEGYQGGAYGLAVKVRPIAGPFRGAMELSPIVVRQAIHVDRKTAQVTAVSDPFPLIHHGVPLRVREVTVLVNRDRFMLNPSDCAQKQVGADIQSDQGTSAGVSNGFQASGCANLSFKPKLALRLTGRRQVRTGKHPGVRAQVTQKGIPEAGIEKAEVRLPKSLALDVENAQALCEFDAGTKPDLENHCPKGSIVGRARAVSPLLNDPLVGNVYFVKNVRRSSSGNLIRTLPMIVVALRGEIAVNLVGDSNVKKGKLVNTFDEVPDAPITKFNLNIKGGRNGILAVTRTRRGLINLCAKPRGHIAEADIDGHNGRRYDRDIRMKTPCARKAKKAVCKTKRQKASRSCKAKRRAAKRRAAARRARAR